MTRKRLSANLSLWRPVFSYAKVLRQILDASEKSGAGTDSADAFAFSLISSAEKAIIGPHGSFDLSLRTRKGENGDWYPE